ncbi:Fucose permease [Sanguibacter gelidistatuariae]|uniref:Fucose permease n=1 Tax=Sanguibacter gelidistatuariae TaxID=1814289 RepID=A0A1G6WWF9_9MICO|nr:MFS transporter [Sanguibacter gelidistatuariae]SDD70238.1 Fucose permease [Sanguibacter gelidistatuariae]
MFLLSLFLLLGINTSSWLARLPTVREMLDLSTADLGMVLLAGAFGSLAAVTLAGSIVARFGGRRVLVVAAIGSFFALALEGIGPTVGSTAILAFGLVLNGMSIALMNVPQNVETAAVERRMGRAVLPQFHAAFSIGAVLGSLIGAACSMLGVPVLAQFLTITTITLVWRLIAIPHVVLDTHLPDDVRWDRADTARSARVRKAEIRAGVVVPEPGTSGPRAAMGARRASLGSALGAWREPRTLFIGVVIMAASLSEGSANNWLPIAVVDGFAETEAIGAFVFGAFVTAMTIVRMFGTRLIDSYGRVVTLRLSGAVAIVGLLLFGFAPNLLVAGAGVVLWGMGAALAVPLGIAAASDDPLKAAARVSVVSAFASMSSLAAPPLLGLAAEAIGARHALTLIVVALVASVLLSKHVAKVLPEAATVTAPALPDAAEPVAAASAPAMPATVGEARPIVRTEHTPAQRAADQKVPQERVDA